jgi:hypothetical protein
VPEGDDYHQCDSCDKVLCLACNPDETRIRCLDEPVTSAGFITLCVDG